MDKLCDRLNQALKLGGIRQADLCRVTGIPKSAMSQYLSGRIKPRQDRIRVIAEALSVDPGWLLGFDVFELDADERRLIMCYRRSEELRLAIDALLDDSRSVFRAAKSKNGTITPKNELMTKERLEQLKNAPETDEDL